MNIYDKNESLAMNIEPLTPDDQAALAEYWHAQGLEECEKKCFSIADKIKNIEITVAAQADYIDSMQKRKKINENKIKNLKKYISYLMEYLGKQKLKGVEYDISVRKNPPKLVVSEGADVSAYLKESKAVIDKERLKDDIKNGVIIEGVELVQDDRIDIK